MVVASLHFSLSRTVLLRRAKGLFRAPQVGPLSRPIRLEIGQAPKH